MKLYFAPMEGLTGYIYRNAHNAFFNNIDKYFSPFISTNQHLSIKAKDLKDILPENNAGLVLIPQLLSNNASDFVETAKQIQYLGYDELNLNLGCPSGTVVSKGKGSGFLAKTEELDRFLDAIYSKAVTKISVKTRLGKDNPEEFYRLMEIYNQYPIHELIIHPRIQKDFYKNKPKLEIFEKALSSSKNPVCYNGDIFKTKDYEELATRFPEVNTFMLGRGLLANPNLTGAIKENSKVEKALLKDFHDKLYHDYKAVLFGDRNVLFKMKGIWSYMIAIFADSERFSKKIKKTERLADYEAVVASLLREQDIVEDYEGSFFFKA